MKRPRFYILIALAALLGAFAGLAGCARAKPAAGGDKLLVAVSILPQKFFVERIAGERVEVLVVVGEGQSPHSYEPSPRQLERLSRAAFWLLSGTDFEQSLEPKLRNLYPQLSIVDGTAGVTFRVLDAHSHGDEDHDEEGHAEDGHADDEHADDEHADDEADQAPGELELDRHTWLGREPAKIMAGHILAALERTDPAHTDEYRARHAALIAEIDGRFDELADLLAPMAGQKVLVFHPAFGYFLDEFGLVQVAVETGGKEPTPKALATLVNEAREEGARAIFVQAQFPVESARSIAASLGAEVLPLDPLAADWLDNIRVMGETLVKAAGGRR